MIHVLLGLAGVGVGAVGSMLGIGGGIFMVPLLLLTGLVATAQGAAGTSIVAVAANGLSSTVAYGRKGVTHWKVGLAVIPGAVGGGWLGPWIGERIASGTLALAFGIFLLYPAGILLLGKQPRDLFRGRGREGLGIVAPVGIGLLAGTAGGLFGIGGGVIMVPALTLLGLDMVPAVATSLLVMIPSAGMAAARHALAGNTRWELALPLALGVVVGSQVGPRIAQRIPAPWLRRLFALVLLYTAFQMIRTGVA
ncbi:MAG: sulfite exporter TauE/SafE family protein [Candidatus Bipolaricaulota bacterium]|nr:sulfite exporter TauE/SafE family protein [Candidatus Bipolaricaulota bacterium]